MFVQYTYDEDKYLKTDINDVTAAFLVAFIGA